MNPIFQYSVIKRLLDYRPKCPRCGLRNPVKKGFSGIMIKCKRCGYQYNPDGPAK